MASRLRASGGHRPDASLNSFAPGPGPPTWAPTQHPRLRPVVLADGAGTPDGPQSGVVDVAGLPVVTGPPVVAGAPVAGPPVADGAGDAPALTSVP